ncbi:MFS transporter [Streptomyces tibetensis]|uniref:MFS transporter n=1 Tax=Streptomyces tibetensis TaxID=2382123 RepID=UPI0033FD2D4E
MEIRENRDAEPAKPAGSSRPAYRDGNVLRWLGAYAASILGDSVYFLALSWAATQAAGPGQAGMVMAVGAVPRAVLMLGGGVIADRLGPRRVLIASDAARAVVLLGAAAALALASPGLWLLVVVALVFGVVDALFMPAIGALPPRITTPDQLARTQGLRTLAQRLGTVAGPSVGGFAMATSGAAGTFAAAGLVFAGSLALLVTLRISGPGGNVSLNSPDAPEEPQGWSGQGIQQEHDEEAQKAEQRSPWRDLAAGVGYLRQHGLLLPLVMVAWLAELGFSGPFNIGLALLADLRGWGPAGMGLVIAAFGAGAVVGALWLAARGGMGRAGLTGAWMMLLGGVSVTGLGMLPSLPAALAAAALAGLTAGVTAGVFSALLQTATDPAYMGRVTSVLVLLTVGIVPLSYPLTGSLIGLLGPEPVFAAYGGICVLATAIVLAVPRLRGAELAGRA